MTTAIECMAKVYNQVGVQCAPPAHVLSAWPSRLPLRRMWNCSWLTKPRGLRAREQGGSQIFDAYGKLGPNKKHYHPE